ncbi:MAG: hypothetical protein HW403_1267, partial [Dehalococcoidia bacterium]|nr:hypothetical protein [Dehalococcoidia bacterium]
MRPMVMIMEVAIHSKARENSVKR